MGGGGRGCKMQSVNGSRMQAVGIVGQWEKRGAQGEWYSGRRERQWMM